MKIHQSLTILVLICSLGGVSCAILVARQNQKIADALRVQGLAAPVLADLRTTRLQLQEFAVSVDGITGGAEGGPGTWLMDFLNERSRRSAEALERLEGTSLLSRQASELAEIRNHVERTMGFIRSDAEDDGPRTEARANALVARVDTELAGIERLMRSVDEGATSQAESRSTDLQAESNALWRLTWLLGIGYAVLVGGVWRWSGFKIVQPLRRLRTAAGKALDKNEPFQITESGPSELRDLTRSFSNLVGHLEQANTEMDSEVRRRTKELRTVNANLVEEIEERRRAEEAKTQIETKMLQAQKMESLGLLAGGIAHDFNNLLVAILGNAELAMEDAESDSRTAEALSRVREAVEQAMRLTSQMLAYAGQRTIAMTTADLNDLIRSTTGLLEIPGAKLARLEYRLAGAVAPVLCDETQIRQIIMNLVINAAEAATRSPCTIYIETGTSSGSSFARDPDIHGKVDNDVFYSFIEVRDDGMGMNAETLERIFDPFFTTKFTGRGLGLAAVLGIVRQHDGAIRVRSVEGEGTAFRLYIPAAVGRVSRMTPIPRDAVLARPPSTYDILLVEDEEVVAAVSRRMLERAGHRIEIAVDGVDAMEKLAARDTFPDVILLDLEMPRMGGRETMERVLADNPKARIILTSGYSSESVVIPETCGSIRFLQKPYTRAKLAAAIQEIGGGLSAQPD